MLEMAFGKDNHAKDMTLNLYEILCTLNKQHTSNKMQ